MIAFIELQATGPLFTSLIKLACSRAPNPFPTFDFLGGQLVTKVVYAAVGERVLGADEFAATAGQVALSLPVSITSIDLTTFMQSPQAPKAVTSAAYVVTVGLSGLSLAFTAVRVDVGPDQFPLATPVVLASLALDQQLAAFGPALITGGAVLFDAVDGIAVVRFATSALSLTLAATSPLVVRIDSSTFDGSWAIFISGGALVNFIQSTLATQLAANLPAGIALSSPPQAAWNQHGPIWGIDASFEIDALNACKSVLGDNDINVTLNAWIVPTPVLPPNAPHPTLDLRGHINHDTSHWDVFVCTIKNIVGGMFGIGTASGETFAIAFFGSVFMVFGTTLMWPGLVYSIIDGKISGQTVPGFKTLQFPDAGDDATLTEAIRMPVLYPGQIVPPGDSVDASVDASGVTIRGTWVGLLPVPGVHEMVISGNPVVTGWDSHFNCNTHLVDIDGLVASPIVVIDHFTAPGLGTQIANIQLFQVLAVAQDTWSVSFSAPPASFKQITVTPAVDASTLVDVGGKVYIHSSAGLAAVPILPVPAAPPQLTGFALVQAITGCQKASAPWHGGPFNLHWLVDPGPDDLVAGVLHEWVVRLDAAANQSTVELERVGATTSSVAIAGTGQAQTIHFVTASEDQVQLSVRGSAGITGSVGQRLLVVSETFELGAAIHAIARTHDGNVAVATAGEVVVMSADMSVVWRFPDRGSRNLMRTGHGTYLWGPGGAYLLTRSGLRPIVAAAVQAAEVELSQIVFHSDIGLVAASQTGVARLDIARIRPTLPPALGAPFLRLSGAVVAVCDGSRLVLARSGRFATLTQGRSA